MLTNKLLKIIIYIFQPAIVFPAGLLLLGVAHQADDIVYAAILILVSLLPILLVRTYYYFKNKQGISVAQRGYLFLIGLVGSCVASTVFGSQAFSSPNWYRLSLIVAVAWGLMYIVNLYFEKVSITTFVFTFVVIMLVGLVTKFFFLLLPVLLLLSYAKYITKQHTTSELLWGITLGLLVGFFTWLVNF